MLDSGFLTIARFRGVPVRLHWSTALGALFFGGMRFVPAFWLAFVVLVVVHELGHAVVVQRLGHRALAVDVTGFGGLCHWDPRRATALDHYLVAWGGVFAQFLLLLLTLTYTLILGAPTSAAEAQIVSAFTTTNLWVIALNLLPISPLDGAQAWRLFGELRRRKLSPLALLRRWLALRRFRRHAAGTKSAAYSSEAAPKPSQGSKAELARIFEKVADEARRARRGD